jgi:predicted PurR-regulated permease PerM
MSQRRQGCLEGLFELFLLNRVFDWLQKKFGFGRGLSCTGIGCGFLLLIIFLLMACNIIFGTDWLRATSLLRSFM